MSSRLLKPIDIPTTLWVPDHDLLLPLELCSVYRETLSVAGLLDKAIACISSGGIGGESEEASAKHFAENYGGSCARTQLAMLDPRDELANASDLFIKAFAGGRVGVLDIPCGSGAGTTSVLLTLAELRRTNILPRAPLEVAALLGDISDGARYYAKAMLGAITPKLEEQAIFVRADFAKWDISDAESTTMLINKWISHSGDCGERFVLVPNFSGFLHNKVSTLSERIGEILRWAAVRRSVVVWIEPQTNKAIKSFWPTFLAMVGKLVKSFRTVDGKPQAPLIAEARYRHPLRSELTITVRLSLVRLLKHP